jgi:hypothetical protein
MKQTKKQKNHQKNMITLTASSSGTWENPEQGQHPAVLCDVILNKEEQTTYGEKDMLYLYFQLDTKMEDGRRHTIRRKFTASLNPKANLNKFLSKWRGKTIQDGESINFKSLIGRGCMLEIEHSEGQDGRIWANIFRATPLAKGDWIKVDPDYNPERTRQSIAERTPGSTISETTETAAPEKKKPAPKVARSSVTDEDDVPF